MRTIILFLSFVITIFSQAPELKVELKNTSQVYCVAVSDDGKFMATGSVGKVFIWDLEEGRLVHCIKNLLYPVFSIGFTTDSKSILLAMGNNNVEMWDIESFTKTTTFFGHSYMLKDLKVGKNGKYFLSLDYKNKIILWDINKGKALREFDLPVSLVHSADFSPSGKELIIGQMDGEIPIIDLATGKTIKSINNKKMLSEDYRPGMSEDSIRMLAVRDYSLGNIVLKDDNKIIAYHANLVTLWDIESGIQEKYLPLNFTPSRSVVNEKLDIAALRNGKTLKFFDYNKNRIIDSAFLSGNDFNALAVHPSGKYFLTGEMDGSVKFLNRRRAKR
ncbi:MAG: hypothetical protein IPJ75_13090 [Ignavibacteriales bacterium]|nr:hypothetical protein [Ignavibacteriales bacterium]